MNIYDIWFYLLKINKKDKAELINKYKCCEEIYEILTLNNQIKDKTYIEKAELVLRKLIAEDIKYVTIFSEDYPKSLKNYDDSPTLLFYKGNIEAINKNNNIGVVGSRNVTPYGINATKSICSEICNYNYNIVSGLALGVDAYAHETALEKNNYTCGIIGCGIDIIYPKYNSVLYSKMFKQGAVVSQFIPGTKPLHYNFPIRNKIISGISDFLIVVEAGEKSGSLITARLAAEMGKEVIVVPGSIFSKESTGANKLIRDGAVPFTDIDDFLYLIGADKKISDNKKDNITPLESKIIGVLTDSPIHIDDIKKAINVDITQIYNVLFEMQVKNKIISLCGNYYVKNMMLK